MKLIMLTVWCGVLCASQLGWCGQEGTGGDLSCQDRIELIRNNIEERIKDGSVNALDFTGTGTTAEEYAQTIPAIMDLTRNEQSSISCTTNPKDVADLVGGTWTPICAAQWLDDDSVKPKNGKRPRILCYSGIEKNGVHTGGLMGMSGTEQYGQIDHEFNVLAGFEDQQAQYSHYLIASRVSEKARAITYWLWPAADAGGGVNEPTVPLSDSEMEIASVVIQNSDKIPEVPEFFDTVAGDVKCVSGRWSQGVLQSNFVFEIRAVRANPALISFATPVTGSLHIIPMSLVGCPADPQFLRTSETNLLDALMRSKSTLDLARATGFKTIISAKGYGSFDRREYRIEIGKEACTGGEYGAVCSAINLGTISISVTFLPPTATEHVVSHFIPKN